jgi:putative transposase
MYFAEGDLFHVYSRGNNSQRIFFNRNNYLFFIDKVKEFVLPYADILAWCLMPNHFHLMIEVLHEELPAVTHRVTEVHPVSITTETYPVSKTRSLNDSIAIMLRSYTRAINKQKKRTGALFQEGTKSICLNRHELSPAYFQTAPGVVGNVSFPEQEYLNICYNYIHQNPVYSGLVKKPEEWEFSSYRDYFCNRDGSFVNTENAIKLGLYDPLSNNSPGDSKSPGE